MNEKINPSNLKDYTEPTWFLGTEVVADCDKDLDLMNQGVGTTCQHEAVAMYATNLLKQDVDYFKKLGYSDYFCEVIFEALKRKYQWVIFDRDLESL